MCFSPEITVAMGALSLGTALHQWKRGNGPWRVQLFVVFLIMECIQLVQHFVVDDCGSWVNQLTTVLAYIHVCFQPLSVNGFIFRNEPNSDVRKTVMRLCFVGGLLAVMRLPYLGLGHVPAPVRALLPGLPDPALAGSPVVCSWEAMCGPRTCTTRGKLHLRWEVPMLPPSYFTPSGFIHFLCFFGPSLVAPGIFHFERLQFVVIALLTGPVGTMLWAFKSNNGAPQWNLEWAGVWCLFSVVQCIMGVGFEYLVIGHDESGGKWRTLFEPATKSGALDRFKKAAREGTVFAGIACAPPGGAKWEAGKGAGNGAANGGGAHGDDDVAPMSDKGAVNGSRRKAA